jgi:pectate lyase
VVQVGSNTTIIGRSGATLGGVGLEVFNQNNVVIRNLKTLRVLAEIGDAISIRNSSNIWLDHLDLSNDQNHDQD